MDIDMRKLSPFTSLVFEYVCGLVWLVNVALVVSLAGKTTDAAAFISRAAGGLDKAKIPDIIAQYLTVLIGVVLPYAAAVTFKPLSVEAMNSLLPYIRRRFAADQVTQEHVDAVRTAMASDLGAAPPGWWAYFLDLYLEDSRCAVVDTLRTAFARAQALMQAALPIAALSGLLIALTGRDLQAAVIGLSVAVLVFFLLAKAAVDAHMRWDNSVVFTYLMFRGRQLRQANAQSNPSRLYELSDLVPGTGA